MSREVGVGVLGYSIGRAHAHAWRNVSEYYYPTKLVPRLVALSGRNKEAVSFEAKKYGYDKVYDDWEKVVEDEAVEIVDNCLPVFLHPEPMIMAARLGKNLVCEKPLARSAGEAKLMLDAAEKAKVKHMTGYNYRFLPAVALARKMVKEGEIGEMRYFRAGYLTTNGGYDSPDYPIRWQHRSEAAGHGAIADLGTHAIDLARFIVGEVSSVSAASKNFIPERPVSEGSRRKTRVDVDDITVGCLKFEGGAIGLLEASWLTPGRMDYLSFEAYGTLGSLRWNLERANELEVFLTKRDAGTNGCRTLYVTSKEQPYVAQYWPNQGTAISWEHGFVNELHHYVSCLEDGREIAPHGATFLDGYRNCLIIDGIAESVKRERWVRVTA